MKNVKVLDCTLRDGGRIIDCKFPDLQIKRMIYSLGKAGIDVIEVGFLRDWRKVKYSGDSTFFTSTRQIIPFLPKERNAMYVAFIDLGMFDFDTLEPFDGLSIDGIRLGFTKKDFENSLDEIIRCANLIKEKGYKLFLQGVNSLSYTDRQLLDLVNLVNDIEPYSFGIVDTYGAMYIDDVQRLYTLIDHNLLPRIAIDFHSHNNYQLSFSLAQEVIRLSNGVRNVIIDATLRGMGKGAGNANTELIVDYLVRKKGYEYNLEKILEIIDLEIYDLFEKFHWGYSPASFMAGIYKSHPNNIIYLLDKYSLSTNDIKNILSMLTDHERERYFYDRIDELYEEYRFKEYDDVENIRILRELIGNRAVLVLAPGKSLKTHKKEIDSYIQSNSPCVISVNFISEYSDGIPFFGNKKRYYSFGYEENTRAIVTSDVAMGTDSEIIISIRRLRLLGMQEQRSSMFMLLNLLSDIGVSDITIAGMDGYSENNEENYFNNSLIVSRTSKEIQQINAKLQSNLDHFIKEKGCDCKVRILTPSLFRVNE